MYFKWSSVGNRKCHLLCCFSLKVENEKKKSLKLAKGHNLRKSVTVVSNFSNVLEGRIYVQHISNLYDPLKKVIHYHGIWSFYDKKKTFRFIQARKMLTNGPISKWNLEEKYEKVLMMRLNQRSENILIESRKDRRKYVIPVEKVFLITATNI